MVRGNTGLRAQVAGHLLFAGNMGKMTSARASRAKHDKSYRERNRDRIALAKRAYRERNAAAIRRAKRVYREQNALAIAASAKAYRQRNREAIRLAKQNYRARHTSEIAVRDRAYKRAHRDDINAKKRIRTRDDACFRLVNNIRRRISNALHGRSKAAHTLELLGCTVEQCYAHLEKQFTPGMSWENRAEWHVDHIRPIASYDISVPAQQRACFHYTNLQPLWARDNLRKGAKYTPCNSTLPTSATCGTPVIARNGTPT